MQMLDNAIEIAKEEIINSDNPTKSDIRDFKTRLNITLASLEKEADEDDEDEGDEEEEDDGEDK